MKRVFGVCLRGWLILCGVSLVVQLAGAEEVVVVLSSDSPAYREALAGFEKEYGHPVPTFTLSKGNVHLPDSAKVFVAIGGTAATFSYPARSTLIYCLAPSVERFAGADEGLRVNVRVSSAPDIVLAKLKSLQPSLKRLSIFWINPALNQIFRDFESAARPLGIELRAIHVERPEGVPEALRALKDKTDALWFIPDPMLMTPGIFTMTKEFASANGVPFYVPIDALVDKGATASVSSSFWEMGRLSGKLAAKAADGKLGDAARVYPQKVIVTINLTAAAQSGLTIPEDMKKKADRVVP